ncbi:MAG: protein-export rane protein SecD [Caulobacter sp.]|nr:protein-export rane protein SecD [Caulobacter sp.]
MSPREPLRFALVCALLATVGLTAAHAHAEPPKIAIYDVDDQTSASAPAPAGEAWLPAEQGRPVLVRLPPVIDSAMVARVYAAEGDPDGIAFELTSEGQRRLHAFSLDHIGRRMAITVDGAVTSVPVLQGAIGGRYSVISGSSRRRNAHDVVCRVDVRSPSAGSLLVQVDPRMALFGRLPDLPQIGWTATPSAPQAPDHPIQLVIGFYGSTLEKLGPPSGGHVDFKPGPGATSENTTVVIAVADGRTWRLSGAAIEIGTDASGKPSAGAAFPSSGGARAPGAIAEPSPDGLALALMASQTVTVTVEQDGQLRESATFDLSAGATLDQSLAQARSRIQAQDPSVCALDFGDE